MTPCVNTGKLRIGIAHVPRQRIDLTGDSLRLQSALLDPRTAQPVSRVQRVIGAIWRWL